MNSIYNNSTSSGYDIYFSIMIAIEKIHKKNEILFFKILVFRLHHSVSTTSSILHSYRHSIQLRLQTQSTETIYL